MIFTSKNIEIVPNCTHRMPFNSFVRQIEIPGDSHPLERFTIEILPNWLIVSTELMIIGSSGPLLSSTSLLILLIISLLRDDDVIESFERIGSCRVLVIYQVLLLQFEIELILPIGFNRHVSYPE